MRKSWTAYRTALWRHSKTLISGAACGLLGIVLSIHPVALPAWFWFLIGLASLGWVSFVAFHDLRLDRDQLQVAVDGRAAKAHLLEALSMRIELGRRVDEILSFYNDGIGVITIEERTPNPFQKGSADALGQANGWEASTYDWLKKSIGPMQATRFRNDLGVPPEMKRDEDGYAPLGIEETRKRLSRRLWRLDEIARELAG